MRRALVLSILLVGRSAFASEVDDYEDETDIKARLLSAYGSPSLRPGLAARRLARAATNVSTCATGQDRVELQLYVEKWHVIDEKLQTYGFDGYLRAWWHDPRLAYTANDCVAKLKFGAEERKQLWRPGFYWEGLQEVSLPPDGGRGELFEAQSDGSIWWSQQVSFVLSCSIAGTLDNLPFDTQKCRYTLGMYSETEAEVCELPIESTLFGSSLPHPHSAAVQTLHLCFCYPLLLPCLAVSASHTPALPHLASLRSLHTTHS